MGKFRDVYFFEKSILSAVLCFWIACLKACDTGCGSSPCICGNCVPELPLGMGFVFRNAPQPEIASRNEPSERDELSQRGRRRKLCPGFKSQNGIRFPVEVSAETASQNSGSEREALSG